MMVVDNTMDRIRNFVNCPTAKPQTKNIPTEARPMIPMNYKKVALTDGSNSDASLTDEFNGEGAQSLPNVRSSAALLAMDNSKKKRASIRTRVVSECVEDVVHPVQAQGKPPGFLSWRRWLPSLVRIPSLMLLLYFFVCSLDFLSTAFRLVAGRAAGSIFQQNDLLSSPVVGLMIGVLFTVLVQSSSTCTSVIVSMVASGIIGVENAIPMIMGANIGTSLTNTLVSFTQVQSKEEFERAFSGATVHDCFNWLTVICLLTIETTTGYLYNLTWWITNSSMMQQNAAQNGTQSQVKTVSFIEAITKPLTSKIIQIDKSVLKCWALGGCEDARLLKVWCEGEVENNNSIADIVSDNSTVDSLGEMQSADKCGFLLNQEALTDTAIGIILLIASLVILSLCLILIVKVLHSLLQGAVANMIRTTINADIPYVPCLTGYIAIIMGAVLTFIVQSSSVFTSTLTPLVGVGLISVDRVYPLTLGSNLGTTTTALIASMAADPDMLKSSVQIALCHLFFNLHGILLFYPIPWMRWPLVMCKVLGRTTAKYRWFAILYLIMMFFIMPATVLSLSMLGQTVLLIVIIPSILTGMLVIFINVLQHYQVPWLPKLLQNWDFLPEPLHSLDPLDRIIARFSCCAKYSHGTEEENLEKVVVIDT